MADLLGLPRPARILQNGAGFSRELEHTGPAGNARAASVPQREQLASTPEPPLPKIKNQSRQSKAPDRKGGGGERVKVRVAPWRERGGSEQKHGEEKAD